MTLSARDETPRAPSLLTMECWLLLSHENLLQATIAVVSWCVHQSCHDWHFISPLHSLALTLLIFFFQDSTWALGERRLKETTHLRKHTHGYLVSALWQVMSFLGIWSATGIWQTSLLLTVVYRAEYACLNKD